MKVLYISHHKEASGWGQAARNYILAMDAVGIEVVPQAIRLNGSLADLPERLVELENKNSQNCTHCVQHLLPNYMKYDSSFERNIGLFVLETKNISHTTWVDHLNLMDELWVPCKDMEVIDGITKPIKLAPHSFDIEKYKSYDKLNISQLNNEFVFYFIGEYNRRKHIGALLRAFHTEFSPDEPVQLVLKVNKPEMNDQELANEMVGFCNKIKESLRLYKDSNRYKSEIIITVHISEEEMGRLHSTCDCFVNPSYGDAWNIPLFDAMGFGNMVISSATGGPKDYIDSGRNGFLVGGTMESVFGQNETVKEFGTSREQWFDISITELMKTMRRVYEMDKTRKDKMKMEAKTSVQNYSYERIGNVMKGLLNV